MCGIFALLNENNESFPSNVIINEFEKLVSFISEEIDKLQNLKDLKKVTSNQFRLRQIKNVLFLFYSLIYTVFNNITHI